MVLKASATLLISLVVLTGGIRTTTGLSVGTVNEVRDVVEAGVPATAGENASRRHGTQVRGCMSPSGKLLAFVQHWHSEAATPEDAGSMTLSTPSGQVTRPADSMLQNKSVSYLDGLCAAGFSTDLITTCRGEDGYDDWAVFEFTVGSSCSTSASFTLLSGNTVVLTEACSGLYPARISGTVACPPTPSPNPDVPTPAPPTFTFPPTPSPPVQATGDPHLTNVLGQRFDLHREGWHTLVQVPKGAQRKAALLSVEGEARQMGVACADMYFQSVNLTGEWVGPQGRVFSASRGVDKSPRRWLRYGKVHLKVVQGHTKSGIVYLNLYVRHLKRAGYPVGGILGMDDHTAAAAPSQKCDRTISFNRIEGPHSPESASVAAADLE